jgi:hypothetical protein
MKHSVDSTEWVIQILKPDHVTTQCRVDVMTSVLLIICEPDYVASRVVKKQLRDICAKLKAAQAAIDELAPGGWKEILHASPSISETVRRAEELADIIVVPKRSGGSSKVRTLAMQKRLAAERALVLMKKYRSGHKSTSMKNDDFYRMAAALFEIATGRDSDMERACAQALSAK